MSIEAITQQRLGAVWPRAREHGLAREYARALEGLTDVQVHEVCDRILREHRWNEPPTPGDLYDFAKAVKRGASRPAVETDRTATSLQCGCGDVLVLLENARMLWCDRCSAARSTRNANGHPVVVLTEQQMDAVRQRPVEGVVVSMDEWRAASGG